MPTWDSAAADDLWTKACGKERWLGTIGDVEQDIRRVSDDTSSGNSAPAPASAGRVRARASVAQLAARARPPRTMEAAGTLRSRRADPRLRAPLRDLQAAQPAAARPERLLRMLTNPQRPVQLIIAGKAHPADLAGQAMIQEWMRFIRRPEVRPHAFSWAITTCAHRTTGAGRGRLAQYAAASLGGVRHERHEGAGQRRTQSFGTGWLVGGSLHAAKWDGRSATARNMATIPHGMRPKPSALRPAGARSDSGVLQPQRARHSRGWMQAHAGKHGAPDAAILGRPRGARVHRETLPARRAEYMPDPRRQHRRNRPPDRPMAPGNRQKWSAVRFRQWVWKPMASTFEVEVYMHGLDPKAVRVEIFAQGVHGDASRRQDEPWRPGRRSGRL